MLNYAYIPFGGAYGVSFVVFACYLAGILIGPWLGFVAGGLADFLGCIAYGYAPNVFILLGSASWGLFSGLAFKFLKCNRFWKLAICGVVSFVVCSMLLNSYGMYTYTSGGSTFPAYVLVRFPIQFTNFACNILFTFLFLDVLERRHIL